MRVRGRPVAWSAVIVVVVLAGGAAVTAVVIASTHPGDSELWTDGLVTCGT